ncbi:hypothetical protein [Achromobacter arsenitoxydans]|uniref:Uncharacterized protein n=1 Tax=Achromobacter arsenitoxydans SY8 TaxID=477184 RepID=H0F0Q6_9BURK|nr:hypothetical protein [Achromobacter arsenitoxydans]EHK68163.1 hypothetical protein KYC_01689 [Achromobacter arsenitoxydans SY8]
MSTATLSRRTALLLLAVVVLAWGFTWGVSKPAFSSGAEAPLRDY